MSCLLVGWKGAKQGFWPANLVFQIFFEKKSLRTLLKLGLLVIFAIPTLFYLTTLTQLD